MATTNATPMSMMPDDAGTDDGWWIRRGGRAEKPSSAAGVLRYVSMKDGGSRRIEYRLRVIDFVQSASDHQGGRAGLMLAVFQTRDERGPWSLPVARIEKWFRNRDGLWCPQLIRGNPSYATAMLSLGPDELNACAAAARELVSERQAFRAAYAQPSHDAENTENDRG